MEVEFNNLPLSVAERCGFQYCLIGINRWGELLKNASIY